MRKVHACLPLLLLTHEQNQTRINYCQKLVKRCRSTNFLMTIGCHYDTKLKMFSMQWENCMLLNIYQANSEICRKVMTLLER